MPRHVHAAKAGTACAQRGREARLEALVSRTCNNGRMRQPRVVWRRQTNKKRLCFVFLVKVGFKVGLSLTFRFQTDGGGQLGFGQVPTAGCDSAVLSLSAAAEKPATASPAHNLHNFVAASESTQQRVA